MPAAFAKGLFCSSWFARKTKKHLKRVKCEALHIRFGKRRRACLETGVGDRPEPRRGSDFLAQLEMFGLAIDKTVAENGAASSKDPHGRWFKTISTVLWAILNGLYEP
jgi:hypothetical protein